MTKCPYIDRCYADPKMAMKACIDETVFPNIPYSKCGFYKQWQRSEGTK